MINSYNLITSTKKNFNIIKNKGINNNAFLLIKVVKKY